MAATYLGWACVSDVVALELNASGGTAQRETEHGVETVSFQLPAVITTDLRLNEPRYVSLPGIMKAKKKPVEELPAAELASDITPRTQILSFEAPAGRKAGVKVRSVDELIDRLKNEAKVL